MLSSASFLICFGQHQIALHQITPCIISDHNKSHAVTSIHFTSRNNASHLLQPIMHPTFFNIPFSLMLRPFSYDFAFGGGGAAPGRPDRSPRCRGHRLRSAPAARRARAGPLVPDRTAAWSVASRGHVPCMTRTAFSTTAFPKVCQKSMC